MGSQRAIDLLDAASVLKSNSEPPVLRSAARRAWKARWLEMLAVCTQDSLAATLVDEGLSLEDSGTGPGPLSVGVWLDAAFSTAEAASEARAAAATTHAPVPAAPLEAAADAAAPAAGAPCALSECASHFVLGGGTCGGGGASARDVLL